MFKTTSREVLKETNNRQRPWQLVSMQGDFVFKLAPATQAPAQPSSTHATDPSMAVWNAIENSERVTDFETFLRTYPASPMAPFAKSRLEALEKTKVAAVILPSKPVVELVGNVPISVEIRGAGVAG